MNTFIFYFTFIKMSSFRNNILTRFLTDFYNLLCDLLIIHYFFPFNNMAKLHLFFGLAVDFLIKKSCTFASKKKENMETLNTLLNHRSIRQYSAQNISEETLQQILNAAVRGSTTGNMQLYSIIVTRDQAMKNKLAPFHFNQPMATSAPLILTFCADFNRFSKWCEY